MPQDNTLSNNNKVDFSSSDLFGGKSSAPPTVNTTPNNSNVDFSSSDLFNNKGSNTENIPSTQLSNINQGQYVKFGFNANEGGPNDITAGIKQSTLEQVGKGIVSLVPSIVGGSFKLAGSAIDFVGDLAVTPINLVKQIAGNPNLIEFNNNFLTEGGEAIQNLGSNKTLGVYNPNPNGMSVVSGMNWLSNTAGTVIPFILLSAATGGATDLLLDAAETSEEASMLKGLKVPFEGVKTTGRWGNIEDIEAINNPEQKLLRYNEPNQLPPSNSGISAPETKMLGYNQPEEETILGDNQPKEEPILGEGKNTGLIPYEGMKPQMSLIKSDEELEFTPYTEMLEGEQPVNNINHTGKGIRDFLINAKNRPYIRQGISSFLDSNIWSQQSSEEVYNNVKEQAYEDGINAGMTPQQAAQNAEKNAIIASNNTFATQLILNNAITAFGYTLPFHNKFSGSVLERMIEKNPEIENNVEGMLGGIDAEKSAAIKQDRLNALGQKIWDQTQGVLHMTSASIAEKAGLSSGRQKSFEDIKDETNNILFEPTSTTSMLSSIVDKAKDELTTKAGLSDAAKGLFLGIGMDIIHNKIPFTVHNEFKYNSTTKRYEYTGARAQKNGKDIEDKPILGADGKQIFNDDGSPAVVKTLKTKLYSNSKLDKLNRQQYFDNAFDGVKEDLNHIVNTKKSISNLNNEIVNAKDEDTRNKLIIERDKLIDKAVNTYQHHSISTGDSRYLHNVYDSILNMDNTTDVNKEMREEANKNIQTLQDQLNNETDPEKKKQLQDSITQAKEEAKKFEKVQTKAQLFGYADNADVDENGNELKDKDQKYANNQKMAREYKDNLSKYEERYKVYDKIINRKKTFEGELMAKEALKHEIEVDRLEKENNSIKDKISDDIKNDPNDINNPNSLVYNHIKKIISLQEKIRRLNIFNKLKRDDNGNIDFDNNEVKEQLETLKKELADAGYKGNSIKLLQNKYNEIKEDSQHIKANSDSEMLHYLIQEANENLDNLTKSDIGVTMYQSKQYQDFVYNNKLKENTREADDAFTKHIADKFNENLGNQKKIIENQLLIENHKLMIDNLVNQGRDKSWRTKMGKDYIKYVNNKINQIYQDNYEKFQNQYHDWINQQNDALNSELKDITNSENSLHDAVEEHVNRLKSLNDHYDKIKELLIGLHNISVVKGKLLEELNNQRTKLLSDLEYDKLSNNVKDYHENLNHIKNSINRTKAMVNDLLEGIENPTDRNVIKESFHIDKLFKYYDDFMDKMEGGKDVLLINKYLEELDNIEKKAKLNRESMPAAPIGTVWGNIDFLSPEQEKNKKDLLENLRVELDKLNKSSKDNIIDLQHKIDNEKDDVERSKLIDKQKSIKNYNEIKEAMVELYKKIDTAELETPHTPFYDEKSRQEHIQNQNEVAQAREKLERLNEQTDYVKSRNENISELHSYLSNLINDINDIDEQLNLLDKQYRQLKNDNVSLRKHLDDLSNRKMSVINKLNSLFNVINPPKEEAKPVKEEAKTKEEVKVGIKKAKEEDDDNKVEGEEDNNKVEVKKVDNKVEGKVDNNKIEGKVDNKKVEEKLEEKETQDPKTQLDESNNNLDKNLNTINNDRKKLLDLKLQLSNLLHTIGNTFHLNQLASFDKFIQDLEEGKEKPEIEDNIKHYSNELNQISKLFNEIRILGTDKTKFYIEELQPNSVFLLKNDFYSDLYDSFNTNLKDFIDNSKQLTNEEKKNYKQLIIDYKKSLVKNLLPDLYGDTDLIYNKLKDLIGLHDLGLKINIIPKKNGNEKHFIFVTSGEKIKGFGDAKYNELNSILNDIKQKRNDIVDFVKKKFPIITEKELNKYTEELNNFYTNYKKKLDGLNDTYNDLVNKINAFPLREVINRSTTIPTFADTKDKLNNNQRDINNIEWNLLQWTRERKNGIEKISFRIPTEDEFNDMINKVNKISIYKGKKWGDYFENNEDGSNSVKEGALANEIPIIREINGKSLEWLETPDNKRKVSYDSEGAYEENYNLRKELKQTLGKNKIEKLNRNIKDVKGTYIKHPDGFSIPTGDRANILKGEKFNNKSNFLYVMVKGSDKKIRTFGYFFPNVDITTMQIQKDENGFPKFDENGNVEVNFSTNSNVTLFAINNAKLKDSKKIQDKLYDYLTRNKTLDDKKIDFINNNYVKVIKGQSGNIKLQDSDIELRPGMDEKEFYNLMNSDSNKSYVFNDINKFGYYNNDKGSGKSTDELKNQWKKLIDEERIITDIDPQNVKVDGIDHLTIAANPTIEYENENSFNKEEGFGVMANDYTHPAPPPPSDENKTSDENKPSNKNKKDIIKDELYNFLKKEDESYENFLDRVEGLGLDFHNDILNPLINQIGNKETFNTIIEFEELQNKLIDGGFLTDKLNC